MTGYGSAEGPFGAARLSIELRSVNHRFFNPSLKLPHALSRWEGEVRELLRHRVARGHLTVSARLEREESMGAIVDEVRFGEYAKSLRELRDRHGLGGEVDVQTVLRMPDVLRTAREDDDIAGTLEELLAVVRSAAEALQVMRYGEGERLGGFIAERLSHIEGAVGRIAVRAPERTQAQKLRLEENVQKLAGGIALDPQRLAQEIAVLADRLDVGEELDRFASHIAAFRESLSTKDAEPVGKRLGFLLQEMLREANTTGSKAHDAPMLQDVVAIKEELERIREQVENLE